MRKQVLNTLTLVAGAALLSFVAAISLYAAVNATNARATKAYAADQARGTSSRKSAANWLRQQKNPNPPPTQIGFLSGTQVPAGGGAFSRLQSAMGDFNGDGNQDLATVVLAPGGVYSISVVLGNGNGTFQPAIITPTTAMCCDPIWAGDMNNDGKDDIVMGHAATSTSPASVEIFLSNGDGTFTSKGVTPVTNAIIWVTLRDMNGDGKLDVVVADSASPGNIWTYLGNGDGTLQAPTSVVFPGQLAAGADDPFNPVAFGDFNGDGVLDFAGPNATTNQVMVYFGHKSGPYNAGVPLATSDATYDSCYVASGDLRGNGKDDIVSANCTDDSITVFLNNGNGSFKPGVYYPESSAVYTGASPVALSIADVNGDGVNDIVATNFLSSDVSVFLGNGDGTVKTPTAGYIVGGSPRTPVLVGDFNNDGKADLIVPDREFNFVYLEGYGDGTFRSALNFYSLRGNGYQPNAVSIATGDFNGDGHPDFVVGNSNGPSATGVTVFLSNPDGSLQPGVSYSSASKNFELEYVVVGDFNGDGKLDIAAADFYNGVVQIFNGNGNGTFKAGATYATDATAGANALGLVAADLNGDGKLDLAVINNHGSSSANVGVLLNNGKGGFDHVVNYALSKLATRITAADLRGDGKMDLIVPLYGTVAAPGTAVAILLGNGNGTFAHESDLQLTNSSATFRNPYMVAVGDVNGDGKPDLAITIQDQTNFNQGIAIALGNGNGTFQAPALLASTLQNPVLDVPLPAAIQMVDLNRDGHLDLIYTNSEFSTVGVMYGKGNGTFYDPSEFATGRAAYDLALADVNLDGAIDAATTGNAYEFSGVSMLLNMSGDTTTAKSSDPHTNSGHSVTFTADVEKSKVRGVTTVPTGHVTFTDGGKVLATLPLASGQVDYTAGALSNGTHNITAKYSGDLNYLATSASFVQVVGQASSSAELTSSAKPYATPGLEVTFTANIASTVNGDTLVPTGKATFYVDGKAAGTAALNSKAIAAFSTHGLAVGTHTVTAQYGGDANFLAAASPALEQLVVLPDYALGANPNKIAVNAGSSAEYTLALTPAYGYDGTVKFSCPSNLPSGVSCSLPNPIVMDGQDAKVTLKLNTTGASAALVAPATPAQHQQENNLWASLGGIGMIGLVFAGDWKKRNRRRAMILFGIVALIMVLALTGCGSGGQGSSGNGGGGNNGGGGTPAGTYTIAITANGSAGTNGGSTAAHTVNLTLVVN
ncbi:MAG TPA: FG-GAP-like repeat-containing protein [Terriglobales bacterium]